MTSATSDNINIKIRKESTHEIIKEETEDGGGDGGGENDDDELLLGNGIGNYTLSTSASYYKIYDSASQSMPHQPIALQFPTSAYISPRKSLQTQYSRSNDPSYSFMFSPGGTTATATTTTTTNIYDTECNEMLLLPKCARCEKGTRKFEHTITCKNIECGKLFHKRCLVLPYTTKEMDDVWLCDDCDRKMRLASLKRSTTSHSPHRYEHLSSSSLRNPFHQNRYYDGRTHICKNPSFNRSSINLQDTKYGSQKSLNSLEIGTGRIKSASSLTGLHETHNNEIFKPLNVLIDQRTHADYDSQLYAHDEQRKSTSNLKTANLNELSSGSKVCENTDKLKKVQISPKNIENNNNDGKIFVKLSIKQMDDGDENSFYFSSDNNNKAKKKKDEQQQQKQTTGTYEFILNNDEIREASSQRFYLNKNYTDLNYNAGLVKSVQQKQASEFDENQAFFLDQHRMSSRGTDATNKNWLLKTTTITETPDYRISSENQAAKIQNEKSLLYHALNSNRSTPDALKSTSASRFEQVNELDTSANLSEAARVVEYGDELQLDGQSNLTLNYFYFDPNGKRAPRSKLNSSNSNSLEHVNDTLIGNFNYNYINSGGSGIADKASEQFESVIDEPSITNKQLFCGIYQDKEKLKPIEEVRAEEIKLHDSNLIFDTLFKPHTNFVSPGAVSNKSESNKEDKLNSSFTKEKEKFSDSNLSSYLINSLEAENQKKSASENHFELTQISLEEKLKPQEEHTFCNQINVNSFGDLVIDQDKLINDIINQKKHEESVLNNLMNTYSSIIKPVSPPPSPTPTSSYTSILIVKPQQQQHQQDMVISEMEKQRLAEMERLIWDQQTKIQRQETQIDDLRKWIEKLECERNTNSVKTNVIKYDEAHDLNIEAEERYQASVKKNKSRSRNSFYNDALEQARNESIREGNDWRTALIDDLVKIISKYPSTLPETNNVDNLSHEKNKRVDEATQIDGNALIALYQQSLNRQRDDMEKSNKESPRKEKESTDKVLSLVELMRRDVYQKNPTMDPIESLTLSGFKKENVLSLVELMRRDVYKTNPTIDPIESITDANSPRKNVLGLSELMRRDIYPTNPVVDPVESIKFSKNSPRKEPEQSLSLVDLMRRDVYPKNPTVDPIDSITFNKNSPRKEHEKILSLVELMRRDVYPTNPHVDSLDNLIGKDSPRKESEKVLSLVELLRRDVFNKPNADPLAIILDSPRKENEKTLSLVELLRRDVFNNKNVDPLTHILDTSGRELNSDDNDIILGGLIRKDIFKTSPDLSVNAHETGRKITFSDLGANKSRVKNEYSDYDDTNETIEDIIDKIIITKPSAHDSDFDDDDYDGDMNRGLKTKSADNLSGIKKYPVSDYYDNMKKKSIGQLDDSDNNINVDSATKIMQQQQTNRGKLSVDDTRKKSNISKSEINLRTGTDNEGNRGLMSVLKNFSTNRSVSLHRSTSAMDPDVIENARSKRETIYETLKPTSPSSLERASYRGYLDRRKFDKFFKTIDRLYCVIEGPYLYIYKKLNDKKQYKILKLTGCRIRTYEDSLRERANVLTGKKPHSLPNKRAFELQWRVKTYQFIVPYDNEYEFWINAIRKAASINHQIDFPGTSNSNNINNNTSINNATATTYNKTSPYDTNSTFNLTSEAIDIKSDFEDEDEDFNKTTNDAYIDAAPPHDFDQHVETEENAVQPEGVQLEIDKSEYEEKAATSERRPLSIIKTNRDIDNINKELNEIFARKIYDFIGYESETSKQNTNDSENIINNPPSDNNCNTSTISDTNSIKITINSKNKKAAPSPPMAVNNTLVKEPETNNQFALSSTNILNSSLITAANLTDNFNENNNNIINNNLNNNYSNNDQKINIVLARTILELNSSDNDDDIQRI